MFERLQKPFLTVETGEAYQPIRINYELYQKENLIAAFNKLKCLEKKPNANAWEWFWRDECQDIHFESLDSFRKDPNRPIRLASITIRDNVLYFNFPSFKRACLAVPFFYRQIDQTIAKPHHADFINKVFGLDERLPHGFTELFKDEELARIVRERIEHYHEVQEQVEHAATADEAFSILSEYAKTESKKRLPFAERYSFTNIITTSQDPDVIFLGFYIFLRGRELVAIRRWFGESGYSLSDAAEEAVNQAFGEMNIDIIE